MLINAAPFRRRARRGMVTVLLAVLLIVCLGILAIALDGGMLMEDQRMVQAAADAAALAAATDLFASYNLNHGSDPNGTAQKSAQTSLAANGYTSANSTITVNIPPKSGPFAGNTNGFVEVIIAYNQKAYFSQVWGAANLKVTARSVARGQWAPTNGIGVLTLASSDADSLYLSSSGSLTVSNSGSVIVNSTNTSAARTGGSGTVTAQDIYVAGGYSVSSQFIGTMHSTPLAVADPLSQLQLPDPNDLPLQSNSPLTLTGNATLFPGVYNGGFAFTGGNLTLQPGIYYLKGGGASISAQSLTGNSVLIYNDPGNSGYMAGPINLSITSNLAVSPPTSGRYQGVSIWQNGGNNSMLQITSNGTSSTLMGSVYVPMATVKIDGNQSLKGAQVISRKLQLAGSGGLSVDPTADRPRVRLLQLVE